MLNKFILKLSGDNTWDSVLFFLFFLLRFPLDRKPNAIYWELFVAPQYITYNPVS